MIKPKKKRITNISLASLILASFSILIIFYNKHQIDGFDFTELRLLNTGNVINTILFVAFSIGIFFHKKVKTNVEQIVLIIGILGLLMIILPADVAMFSKKIANLYLFGTPIHKILSALKYILFEFFFVMQISFLFLTFFHVDHVIYLKGLFFTSNIFIVLFIFTYLYILKSPVSSEENIIDGNNIGVVLGAAVWSDNNPSPIFQSRIRKAFILLKDKKISKILVMGGSAPGEVTEAAAAFKMLLELGVNKNQIITEEKTSTTFEQIKFIATNEYLKKFDNIIIISDSFHLTRVREMSSFFRLSSTQISSEHKLKWEKLLYFRIRETFALLFFWLFGI